MIKVYVGGKVRDMGQLNIYDTETGETLYTNYDHGHYMPYIDYLCGGDYIEFEIDNETGRILNWVPLDPATLGEEENSE